MDLLASKAAKNSMQVVLYEEAQGALAVKVFFKLGIRNLVWKLEPT